MSTESTELEALRDVINNASIFRAMGHDNVYCETKIIVDVLLFKYSTIEEDIDLLEQTKNIYFVEITQRDDNDAEKIKFLKSFKTIHNFIVKERYK